MCNVTTESHTRTVLQYHRCLGSDIKSLKIPPLIVFPRHPSIFFVQRSAGLLFLCEGPRQTRYAFLSNIETHNYKMPGGGIVAVTGTTDVNRVEAPVTVRAYLIVAFAAFGGIFFGYDTGWMGGVLNMDYFIQQYTGAEYPDVKYPGLASTDQTIKGKCCCTNCF
jgi:hypothetical protein